MFEQRGSFGGLDTCNHVEFGKFNKCSILRHDNEDRSIANRLDINIHLNSLVKHKIISSEMANDMRNSAQYSKNVKIIITMIKEQLTFLFMWLFCFKKITVVIK